MTVITGDMLSVDNYKVRAVYDQDWRPTMQTMVEWLSGLDRLVMLAAVAEGGSVRQAADKDIQWRLKWATEVRERTVPLRMSYNSPLEVTLAFMGMASAGLVVANRMIATFNHFQDARVKKSESSLRMLAHNVLREELLAATRNNHLMERSAVREHLSAGADALSVLTSMEVLEPEGDA